MPIRQLQLDCAVCNSVMPHNQTTPNHVVHGIVSVCLIGLWIPVWLLIAVSAGKDPATCVKCGNRRLPTGPAAVHKAAAPTSRKDLIWFAAIMAVVIGGLVIYSMVAG